MLQEEQHRKKNVPVHGHASRRAAAGDAGYAWKERIVHDAVAEIITAVDVVRLRRRTSSRM